MTLVPEIRPATREDVDACVGLAVAELGEPAETWRERFDRELDDAESFPVVAELVGGFAGFGRTAWLELPENAAPSGYYLVGILVPPSARRRGIGRELTAARLRWIRDRAQEAWYFTNARNEASLALHRQIGFAEVTRAFWIPKVSFDGGEGVLCRISLGSAGIGLRE